MANFNEALKFILKHEGTELFIGPNERSRYGITEILLMSISYNIKDPNNLQMNDVEWIYNKVFWEPKNLDCISSQLVANKIFDMMVNMGTYQSTKLVQAALNSSGNNCVIDGKLGPHTMIEINHCDEEKLLSELVLKCITFYKSIAKNEKAKYLAGWLTRAEDISIGTTDKTAFNTLRTGDDDKIVKG